VIAGANHVEAARAVGEYAREHVEPPGGALGVGRPPRSTAAARQALQQRHDVDAVGLQHRAVGEVDFVQLQLVDTLGTVAPGPGRKLARTRWRYRRGAIEARRLDLALDKGIGRQDEARIAIAAIMRSGEFRWRGRS